MTGLDAFGQNARINGLLIDSNLLVLLVVGSVNRDRIPRFKRTSQYTSVDWDLLSGVLAQFAKRYTLPHVLTEVSALSDLRGPELDQARSVLLRIIGETRELQLSSAEACSSAIYFRLGLTDAAIAQAAKLYACSVLTNDAPLYAELASRGVFVALFDHLRAYL